MLLKQIGAGMIFAGIVFGVLAMNVARITHFHGWLYEFWPLIMFLFFVVGATIGVAGMIASVIQRRRKNSN